MKELSGKTLIPRRKILKLFTNQCVYLSCFRLLIKLWSGLAKDSEAHVFVRVYL